MTLFKSAIVATLIATGFATSALAHDTQRIERTQAHQRATIEQGRWDGSLTKREQRALIAEQEYIDALRRHAKADGRVTGREVRAIREAQHRARLHIAAERHDSQVNFWRRWKSRRGL
ncbi:MAG: hypothetical protein R3D44_01415 [Hyphomicrobiaceae bacterium]